MGYFWMAPSIVVVCLVAETQNGWKSQEPCRRPKLGPGAFFLCVKNGLVYFLMAPSIGVVCLVAQTQKKVLAKPGIT